MAVLRIGYYWHLRWLENHTILFLKKKELSTPKSVRESVNIKIALKCAEDAINQPGLLSQEDKEMLQEYLSDLDFAYRHCCREYGEKSFEDIHNDWKDSLIVIEARIEGTFLPAIQRMAILKVMESRHEHLEIDLSNVFKSRSKVLNVIRDLADSPSHKVKHDINRHGKEAIRNLKEFLGGIGKAGYKGYFKLEGGYIVSEKPIKIITETQI